MDADHVRMRHPGHRARLAYGASHPYAVLLVAMGEDVQFLGGDRAIQQPVVGAPHGAHPAPAENVVEQIPAGDQSLRAAPRTCRRLIVAMSRYDVLSHVSLSEGSALPVGVARSPCVRQVVMRSNGPEHSRAPRADLQSTVRCRKGFGGTRDGMVGTERRARIVRERADGVAGRAISTRGITPGMRRSTT